MRFEPEVRISYELLQKMRLICNVETDEKERDDEIYGLLIISETEEGFLIEDILIPKQEVSGSSVDFEISELGEFVASLPKEKFEKCRGWFHSHGNMSAFWSTTDEENISDYLNGGDYLISLVMGNNGNEMRLRVDEKTIASRSVCTWDKMKLVIDYPNESELKEEVDEIVKGKIKKKPKVINNYARDREFYGPFGRFDKKDLERMAEQEGVSFVEEY